VQYFGRYFDTFSSEISTLTVCLLLFASGTVAALAASLWVENLILSILLAVWGASSLWGIGELFEQRERVAKGWFPKREKKNRRGGR